MTCNIAYNIIDPKLAPSIPLGEFLRPPHILDLASFHYHLFGLLKRHLAAQCFVDDTTSLRKKQNSFSHFTRISLEVTFIRLSPNGKNAANFQRFCRLFVSIPVIQILSKSITGYSSYDHFQHIKGRGDTTRFLR